MLILHFSIYTSATSQRREAWRLDKAKRRALQDNRLPSAEPLWGTLSAQPWKMGSRASFWGTGQTLRYVRYASEIQWKSQKWSEQTWLDENRPIDLSHKNWGPRFVAFRFYPLKHHQLIWLLNKAFPYKYSTNLNNISLFCVQSVATPYLPEHLEPWNMKIGAPRHPFLCHEPTADVVVGAEVPTARSKSFRDHPDQHLRLVAGREQLHLADMPWESMGNILGNAMQLFANRKLGWFI